MPNDTRLANEAWEALFRAQSTIEQELHAAAVWDELQPNEYGVLYELSKTPEGRRLKDLQGDVLLSQAGVSRLVNRLEALGLIGRTADGTDRRASVLTLTPKGHEVQRKIGRQHARRVTAQLTSRLDSAQLTQLRDLCLLMLPSHEDSTDTAIE
ncbi:MarR family winged helix-turn-helix transcriptional regulator [Herbiconiux sp. CPCC 205763]|uniref:MarR family winged helix-turn-helix transcriptional regulator n=1 Tax=Herbiconiux aconitum TaxID=2970913 RepID=A0ABT2GPN6_9MICO|nr:MarR family winged helix-turn-helix transcriptional regulator [Herbiconiux aconitum]MCS5717557.1 MarR family winged helix-turn-helix transcriptional regulator [Herbiconiux aconitum]